MIRNIAKIHFNDNFSGKSKRIWTVNSWWGLENYYFIEDKHASIIQNVLKYISKSDASSINKGDIVYASKASEIPRFKLKEFIKENKLKKTSRYQYSNCIIINRGYFNDLLKELKYGEYYFINGNSLNTDLDSYVNKNHFQHINIKSFIEGLLKKTDNKDLVFMVDDHTVNDYKNHKMNNSDKINFEAKTHIEKGIYINFYRQNKIYELFNILCNIGSKIITGEIKIIFDEDLLVSLNKEGIELDDDYLQTLRDMLFSSDKSNVSLGFEMISNLVLNNHTILSISFLLNELYHTKGFRHSYYSSNSNLKSLLKLLNTKKIYWERDWKTFGTGLRLNFKDGKEGEVVKKFLLDNINREFKLSNSAAESLVDIVFTTEAQ
jgi:hypothetical protein